MDFKILTSELLPKYKEIVKKAPSIILSQVKQDNVPVDYFQFYKSVSSVYSSKIEGEDIDFDSYFKHKFLKVKFKPNYTRKADDLYLAYNFIDEQELNLKNVRQAHSILSTNFLPKSQQGLIRTNPMFVINPEDKIEYIASNPNIVKQELEKLFHDINLLKESKLDSFEVFYYAALLHLVFVKIHPLQDGNGRVARLIEKWFLISKIGEKSAMVQLEKNYYRNLSFYYQNIKKIGLEYESLDYKKSLDFLLMTVQELTTKL